MQISVTDAQAQLSKLVRRAESGEEVVLTLHGRAAVRLVAVEVEQRSRSVRPPVDLEARRRVLEEIVASGARHASPGPCAARGQDFLHGEDGLPA